MTWEYLYELFGIKDFIYFVSDPQLQDTLFPVKLIFLFFAAFFLLFVIYFMLNSSWLQYKFLEEATEFFSWQSYGQRQLSKQWDRIRRRIVSGTESDYKLAIIDADDLLFEVMENRGYEGETFEEMAQGSGKLVAPILADMLKAHETRNAIVYNPDYKISAEEAKKILDTYETAVKSIGMA